MTEHDIKVSLHFIGTAEGGRKTPVKSGYRTQFHFIEDNDCNDYTITLQFDGKECVSPGDNAIARGVFLCKEPLKLIEATMPFELHEGQKVIATGNVISKSI